MEATQQIETDLSAPSVQAKDSGVDVGGVQASPDVEITNAPAVEAPAVETPQLDNPGGGSGGGPVTTQPVETPELNIPSGGVSVGGSDDSGGGPVATTPAFEPPQLDDPGGGDAPEGTPVTNPGLEPGDIQIQPVEDLTLPGGGSGPGGGSDPGGAPGGQPNGVKVIVQEGRVEDFKTGFLVNEKLVSENGTSLKYKITSGTDPRIIVDNLSSLVLVESIQAIEVGDDGSSSPTPPPQTGKNGVAVQVKPGQVFNFTASFMLPHTQVDRNGELLLYRVEGRTPPSTLANNLRSRSIVVDAFAVDLSEYSLPSGGGGTSAQDAKEYLETLRQLVNALDAALKPLAQIQRTYPEDIADRAASLESEVSATKKRLNEEISRTRAWLQENTAEPGGPGVGVVTSGPGASVPALNVGGGASVPALDAGGGAAVPALDAGGGAAVPALDAGGGAAVPALDAGGGAAVPALDAGGGASVPALNAGDGAAIPSLDEGGAGVSVGGVGVGDSLPELSV